MNESPETELPSSPEDDETQGRRNFLQSMGKWSGAAISAAVAGSWLGSSTEGGAAVWINRRGGWVNRGGSWVNRGGGGWVNRSGGGGWVNRGGGGWVNRRRGGGSWINRR